MNDKPRLSAIRLLNDLADRRAILSLLGKTEAEIDADGRAFASRRIGQGRRLRDPSPPDKDWVDGRWIAPEQ